MHKWVLSVAAVVVSALVASSSGSAGELAAGSAKTDLDVIVGLEHASFGAYSSGGADCAANGQIAYRNDTTGDDFTAKVVVLDTDTLPPSGAVAFFLGKVTKVTQGTLANVGDFVSFYASDSGMPGGTGDTFELGLDYGPTLTPTCEPPTTGHPIDSGNIVIKTGP